jgi:hypothetical protein
MMTKMLQVNEAVRELRLSEASLRWATKLHWILHVLRELNDWPVYPEEGIVGVARVLSPTTFDQLSGVSMIFIPKDVVHHAYGS